MDNDTDKILRISDLEIGYFHNKKRTSVFNNISLSARKGELVGLIGKNGIGKSTLLKTIARLNKRLAGEIFLNNKKILDYDLREWAKNISFVSTDPLNISNLTVKELISLGRHPYTNWMFLLSKFDEEIINKAISLVKINHLVSKNIDEISDGERQRVLIARALAQNTDIIILDEPTAFLDLPNKYEIIHLLHELSKNEWKTIIFSSHDLNISITEADKIWLMDDKNIYEGAPEDLVLNGIFEHLFDNSLVNFDKTTGEVKLSRKQISEIYLTGSGNGFFWTKRALERLNYQVNEKINNPVKVNISSSGKKFIWELELNKKKFAFNSIYELNLHLKQLDIN